MRLKNKNLTRKRRANTHEEKTRCLLVRLCVLSSTRLFVIHNNVIKLASVRTLPLSQNGIWNSKNTFFFFFFEGGGEKISSITIWNLDCKSVCMMGSEWISAVHGKQHPSDLIRCRSFHQFAILYFSYLTFAKRAFCRWDGLGKYNHQNLMIWAGSGLTSDKSFGNENNPLSFREH